MMKLSRQLYILFFLSLGFSFHAFAHHGPIDEERKKQKAEYRFNCSESRAEVDLEVNNVRARLQIGGDLFWDFEDGRYIVPKRDPESGLDEVSSIFAAAVWLGGVLPGDNPSLKIACQDYRTTSGVDFYPGPLRDEDASTDAQLCREWDRFFRVRGDSIRKHLDLVERFEALEEDYPEELVPIDVKRWPAIGNPFFNEFYDFELPDAEQGLGNFWNADEDPNYDPTKGDFPIIDIRGCSEPQFPDDMYFWIYNDAGNRHEVTEGTPIRMEVQVQAFGYKTQDEINNMTFYRYKLINRAPEPIDSTFFAMWVDPDLGCSEDDFIGCDTAASLMYVYNDDAEDGNSGCNCTVFGQIIPTYCTEIPILGVDYFRGPLSEPRMQPDGSFQRVDLGMTSFTYYNRGVSNPPTGTTDPNVPIEYYRLLNGFWKDATPLTYGGSGYGTFGRRIRYAFTDPPDLTTGWSMCTSNLPFDDRRTIQATGPFRLDPGAINELIIGVVWLPEADYPCPSIDALLRADQTAQGLFDACFEKLDGPDAPTMCPLELDQEVVFTLFNSPGSNNAELKYEEIDPKLRGIGVSDTTYNFEGYRIYQLKNADIKATQANFNDITKAREILKYDLENNITTIYNWTSQDDPFSEEPIWSPIEMVEGTNSGVAHSFSVTQDAFATGEDVRLINFQKYYFAVIAYAHNNFEDFDVNNPTVGQRTAYIVGDRNVKEYTVVPRKTAHLNLNTLYGEGLQVTRLDGDGVMNNTLMISDETRQQIVENNSLDELTWMPGGSPLNAKIYDPVNVKNGEYLLSFDDFEGDPNLVVTKFKVEEVNSGEVYESETTLDVLNETLINKFGFSVYFAQGAEPATDPYNDESNGFLGSAAVYADPNGIPWYSFVPEGITPAADFLKTNAFGAPDYDYDPNQVYSRTQTGFYPFLLCAYDTNEVAGLDQTGNILYSPSWFNSFASQMRKDVEGLSNLNNVDIVFTSDKDLWSKCMIVQTANYVYEAGIAEDNLSMDLLRRPSVTKDAVPGMPNTPAEADDGTVGYGYFPGYAVDVETGKRLNIFFGENTFFSPGALSGFPDSLLTGNDRMWNPNENIAGFDNLLAGGLHYIFVTNLEYDGCEVLHDSLLAVANRPAIFKRVIKRNIFKFISWSGFPIMFSDPNSGFIASLLSYEEGLIPNDLTISLRVKNSFQKQEYTGSNNGFNQYRIIIDGKQSTALNAEEIESALDLINVVPNPYYAYSVYENSATENIVKITNLPPQCDVTIYSLDGKFIRKYERNARGGNKPFLNAPIPETLFASDIQWDLKNDNGIPVASGVYFIHIEAPGLGDRVIKWFGINRKFDPSAIN